MAEPAGAARALSNLIAAIDRLARGAAWLCALATLACVALVSALVVARYAFSAGSQAVQELVVWLHAGAFLFGLAWTLREDGHVRVDIFQQRFPPRVAAWVEVAGGVLFLLPFCTFVVWMSWDYVAASWAVREGSREPGGLPALYLLKGMLPAAAALLGLQALAQVLRALRRALGGADT
ncbi:MAG: TRAP transporter small permease subunit [Rehaibacterium terrae]|uniref:TRAP transporter small permease subunit n=1 Tax=Rehaibacterium terrae TaxID=1341696 RepID=UPI00391A4A90